MLMAGRCDVQTDADVHGTGNWTQGSDTRQSLWAHLEMTGWGSSGGQRDHRSLLGNGRRIFGCVAFAFHKYSVGHQGGSSHLWIESYPGERRERTIGRGQLRTLDTKLVTTNIVSKLTKS